LVDPVQAYHSNLIEIIPGEVACPTLIHQCSVDGFFEIMRVELRTLGDGDTLEVMMKVNTKAEDMIKTIIIWFVGVEARGWWWWWRSGAG